MAGQGTYICHHGQSHTIEPGSVFLRLPRVTHSSLLAEEPYEEWCLTFDVKSYIYLVELGIAIPDQPFLQLAPSETTIQLFSDYLNLLRKPDSPAFELMLRAQELLVELQRRAKTETDPWDEIVRRARQRLAEHPERRIPVAEIARELGVGYHTFRRIFREKTGSSPADYRICCRIDAACHLLATHSVKETADRLGYPDPFTFSEQFKHFTGISPRQYR